MKLEDTIIPMLRERIFLFHRSVQQPNNRTAYLGREADVVLALLLRLTLSCKEYGHTGTLYSIFKECFEEIPVPLVVEK